MKKGRDKEKQFLLTVLNSVDQQFLYLVLSLNFLLRKTFSCCLCYFDFMINDDKSFYHWYAILLADAEVGEDVF